MRLTNHLLKNLLLIFSILVLGLPKNQAQEFQNQKDTTYLVIKTLDKKQFIGNKTEETVEYYQIETKDEVELKILKKDIKRIEEVPASLIKNGEYWFEVPNAGRNLLSPTGYGLKKGTGYYQNSLLLLNSAGYGFSKNFSLEADIVISGFPTLAMTSRFSFPIIDNTLNAGAGFGINFSNSVTALHVFGGLTLGSRASNLSVGVGYLSSFTDRPIVTTAGNLRLTKNISLATEIWILPDVFTIFSGGVRLMARKISVDLRVVTVPQESATLPVGAIIVPFGKHRL